MGHSEAHVDNLHAEVQIIRCENGEWIWKNGICENCPKKAQLMQSLDLFHGEESVSKR